ncbi:hypothetical protein C1701_09050 [Actinoalloteichus sp. AHMU CJ021]|uniref:Uncharacterized protein n=1 Tax=Actinoalloteichus caeruleus DSM 43889 TaxID=1120930 RepID=A0ABT1JKB4_ACTCY|nr:hypothetical protein [Actinoalloteichus caeruleus]AUS78494.1 hypothetical protein C1701_09050 [Actinoalloteichus sp. AHMU CJ021]MCP2332596.1 hypothetical protein [Actinoalloteichus caeruleus DSM 43889]
MPGTPANPGSNRAQRQILAFALAVTSGAVAVGSVWLQLALDRSVLGVTTVAVLVTIALFHWVRSAAPVGIVFGLLGTVTLVFGNGVAVLDHGLSVALVVLAGLVSALPVPLAWQLRQRTPDGDDVGAVPA